ncbi:MAG: DUF4386 domain-containing protein [Anaerolineae bacterium]|nr:DUF4386 domain-containing protein [Anaerolineae bacterium]
MTNRITDISLRQAAIAAGIGLLLMTILAPFAEFFVRQNLIVPGDAATTAKNIRAGEWLFRMAICSYLIVAILDVVVAWALYVLLKPVNNSLSLLAGWFRLVYAAIFAIALHNLLGVLHLLSGADYLTVFETDQLYAQVMLFLNGFNGGWDIGVVFFGLHLFTLGYLVFKSGYIPKILGVLLMIASFGYLADSFGKFLSPNYGATIAMFTFIGEVLFMFWLLFKGTKIPEMKS